MADDRESRAKSLVAFRALARRKASIAAQHGRPSTAWQPPEQATESEDGALEYLELTMAHDMLLPALHQYRAAISAFVVDNVAEHWRNFHNQFIEQLLSEIDKLNVWLDAQELGAEPASATRNVVPYFDPRHSSETSKIDAFVRRLTNLDLRAADTKTLADYVARLTPIERVTSVDIELMRHATANLPPSADFENSLAALRTSQPTTPNLPPERVASHHTESPLAGDTLAAHHYLHPYTPQLLSTTSADAHNAARAFVSDTPTECNTFRPDHVPVDVEKDEGDLNETLRAYFKTESVPRTQWKSLAAEIERLVRQAKGAGKDRPLWANRAQHPDLSSLTAPEFLKQVWADQIAPDGSIDIEFVRSRDSALGDNVVKYIEKRRDRGQDLGRARGLRLVSTRQGRPKSMQHG